MTNASKLVAVLILLVVGACIALAWRYQDMPMTQCAWCHRTTCLNRHHSKAQSFEPQLRDVQTNIVVLCRDCHFVLGHRCDWRQYNPDILEIIRAFTNVVEKTGDENP